MSLVHKEFIFYYFFCYLVRQINWVDVEVDVIFTFIGHISYDIVQLFLEHIYAPL